MKFLLHLVMFFLLLNVFESAQSLIQDSYKKAADKNNNFKYDFCVKSLGGNPQSKTATSLDGLVMASTKSVMLKTSNLKDNAAKILKEKKYEKDSLKPLRDCLEIYSDAKDSLTEALMIIRSRDYKTVNVVLSAAMGAPSTCETGFK